MNESYLLYAAPDSRNVIVQCVLEHLNVDYSLKMLSTAKGDHKTEEYLQINPFGLIPSLEIHRQNGEKHHIYETLEIVRYFLDIHDKNHILKPHASHTLGPLSGTLLGILDKQISPAMSHLFYSHRYAQEGARKDFEKAQEDILRQAFNVLEKTIKPGDGPYLLGAQPSVCDFYAAAALRWVRIYPQDNPHFDKEMTDYPKLKNLLSILETEPSVQNAFERIRITGAFLTNPQIPKENEGLTAGLSNAGPKNQR